MSYFWQNKFIQNKKYSTIKHPPPTSPLSTRMYVMLFSVTFFSFSAKQGFTLNTITEGNQQGRRQNVSRNSNFQPSCLLSPMWPYGTTPIHENNFPEKIQNFPLYIYICCALCLFYCFWTKSLTNIGLTVNLWLTLPFFDFQERCTHYWSDSHFPNRSRHTYN